MIQLRLGCKLKEPHPCSKGHGSHDFHWDNESISPVSYWIGVALGAILPVCIGVASGTVLLS